MTAQSILIRIFLVFPFIFLPFSPRPKCGHFFFAAALPHAVLSEAGACRAVCILILSYLHILVKRPGKIPSKPEKTAKGGPSAFRYAGSPPFIVVCMLYGDAEKTAVLFRGLQQDEPAVSSPISFQAAHGLAREGRQGSFVRPALPFPRKTFRFIASLPLSSFIRKGDFQRETKQETGQRKMQAKPLSALSEFYRHGSFHPDFHEVPVRALHFEQLARHAEGNEGDHLRKIHRFQPIAPLSVPELRRQRPVADEHLDQL